MKKKKWLARSAVVAALLIIVTITAVISVRALGFEDYYVTEDNSFRVTIKQNKASSSATVKYSTAGWYLFPEKIKAADNSTVDTADYPGYSTFNASFYSGAGFPLSTSTNNRVDRQELGSFYYDTYEWSAETMLSAMQKWIKAGQLDRDQLSNGITLYASRPLTIKKNNNPIGTVYSYPEMVSFSEAKGIDWSSKSWDTFYSETYDKPITVQFAKVGMSYQVVDEKGNEIEHNGITGFTEPDVYYGETISTNSPGEIMDYKYLGYELKAGNTVLASGAGKSVNYTAKQSQIKGNNLTLTFKYEKVEAEMPFSSPTPEPTQVPGATATPTPTPTPAPTQAPTPTSQPTQNTESYRDYYRSYSTDKGYYMGKFLDSSTYKLANYASPEGFSMNSCSYVSRSNNYKIGTDSSGNTWYFDTDGTNAVYVHPAVYNGYAVESEDIKYITELVFPSTITYNGTAYTVTSIGSGTAKYKTYDSGYTDTMGPSNYGTYTSYDYGKLSGGYYYTQNYAQDAATDVYQSFEINYIYGVMGNGEITSYGYVQKYYKTTYVSDYSHKANSYHFYNTTLKKVTIPDTVTEILSYAFYHCQALETIEGGKGVTSIGPHAFEAWETPVIQLSTSGVYHYYNDSYSTAAYTDVMTEFRLKCFLSDKMTFPYLPALKTLDYMSFAYHYNISDVDLSETVTTIYSAFVGCKLDNIRIPNASVVITANINSNNNDKNVLGTKGYSLEGDTTKIHCKPDSTAMAYGLKYDGNYVLYCGYPVTYEPNGAPGSAQEVYSALNIDYGYIEDDGIRLSYPNYKVSNLDSTSYSSSAYQYESYLDPDGVLWRLDTTNKTMTMVSAGTTFTDLFADGSAHFAYDSGGNLWVSGQQRNYYTGTDSWGDESFYASYSSQVAWRKMTLPAGTVKTQLTDRGVFALDSNGVIWWCKISENSNVRMTSSTCTKVFTDFCFMTYLYDEEYNYNSYLVALDADGNLYRTYYYNSSEDSHRPAFNLNNIYSSGWNAFEDDDFHVIATDGVKVSLVQNGSSSLPYAVVLTEAGALKYYYQNNTSTCTTYSDYVFKEMEPYSVMGQSGLKLKDSAGNTYFAYIGSSYNKLVFIKVASAGVEIKESWYDSAYYFSDSSTYGCDYEDGYYYQPRMYVWTDDGYLTVYSGQTKDFNYDDWSTWDTTYLSNTSWKAASVKFKKIYKNSFCLFAIAEDGTLWSGGDNSSGQLGHASTGDRSYGYEYPSANCSMYLLKTGDRTYTDVYFSANFANCPSTVYAMGTDGVVYRTGYYYVSGVGSSERNIFGVAEEQSWPGPVTRFIKGYDYDTILVNNPFTYSGYEFKGWNTAADGSGTLYYPGDGVELDSAMTVYAQWGRSNNVITYNANGGYGTMAPTVLDYYVTSTTLAANKFAREGYTFNGWNTASDGTGTSYADGASITVSQGTTTTLYAQWKAEEYISNSFSYTLVYMTYPYGTAGNTVWKTKTLAYETVETVEGQPYTPASGYTVTYNINKPSGMSTVPAALSKTSDSIGTPTFNKWRLYRKNASGEYVYAGSQYAKGSTLSKLTQENGGIIYLYPSWNTVGAYVILPYTEAEGYVFEGWSEAADGSSGVYEVYPPEDEENIGTFTPSKHTILYGAWTPLTYDVALDGQSATTHTQTSVTMTFDSTCPSVTVPARSRYVFMGYYTGTEGTGTQYYDKTGAGTEVWRIADGSVSTLYAYWVPDKAIIYDANGGTGTIETTWIDADKTSATLTACAFTKTGYHFNYWCQTGASCPGSGASGHIHYGDGAVASNITTRVTMYAQWAPNEYKVTLNPNGGTSNSAYTAPFSVYYEQGTNNNIATYQPSRTGYNFTGWYTAVSGGTKVYNADGSVTKEGTYFNTSGNWVYPNNVTLYAHWTPNVYKLSYDLVGNKTTASTTPQIAPQPPTTATYDVTFTVANPTRVGYTFLGWDISNMSDDCKHYYGSYTTALRIITKTKETVFKNLHSVTDSTVKFTAQWQNNTYTVTLDINATGANPAAKLNYDSFKIDFDTTGHVYGGSTKTDYLKSNVPTRTGYTFQGWYTAATGGTKVYNADGSITKEGTYFDADGEWVYPNNVTFYAQWTPNNYNITVNGNKGTGSSAVTVPYSAVRLTFDSANHYYNGADHSNYLAGNLATRPGYTFQGYYTAASDGTQLYTSTGAIANSGTVTYPGYESGYYFYQNKYKYASDMTIYAQWKPITYTVTLNLNDPGAIPVAKIPYGSFTIVFDTNGHTYGGSTKTDYLSSNLPSRVGYTFDGWYTAASGGTKVYNADGSITKEGTYFDSTGRYVNPNNVTLYAHWTANKYTLTLEGNKGAGSTTVTVPYNKVTMTYDSTDHTYNGLGHNDYLAGDISSRIGYTFQGYFTAATGGIKIYNADGSLNAQTIADSANAASASGYYFHTGVWKVANDVTFYAQWKPNSYNVVFDARGGRFDYSGSKVLSDMTIHEFENIYSNTTNYPKEFTYTYIFDDKITNAVRTKADGTTTTTVAIPVKTGYKFGGYYTQANGQGAKVYDASGTYCYSTADAFNFVGTTGGFKWADLTRIYAYWIPTENDADGTTNPYKYPEFEYTAEPEELEAVSGIIGVDMSFDVHDAGKNYDVSDYIPTTEDLAATGSIASHLLLYQFEADMERTPSTFIYNVTVPCTIQYVDSTTEELVFLHTSVVETVEVPSYATQYTLSKFALFELEDLKIGSVSVLEDIKYSITNAAAISCKEETDTTSVVDGKVYTYQCGNITIKVYDDHSSTTGYAKDIHANSLYNAKSEYNKGYFIATTSDGKPQSGSNLTAAACTFNGITYSRLVNIIANNTGIYIGGNTKSDSISIQTKNGEIVIGGTKDAVTSNECLASADVTITGEQAVFPLNGRALNDTYELEYIAGYKAVSDFAAFDTDSNDSTAKSIYKTRYAAMKTEAFKDGQTAYHNTVTSNDVSYNLSADFANMTVTLTDGDLIDVHTPVASNSQNFNIDLSSLYTEITITPDNKYQGTGYLYSRSQRLLLNKKGINVTNGLSTAPQNVVCFPFDVWDKETGKFYAAGTSITLGTTYNADGTPVKGTTFLIPSSIKAQSFTYATAAVASNAPDAVLELNNIFVKSSNTLYRNELIAQYFAAKTNRDLATLNPGESINDKYIAYSASTIKLNSAFTENGSTGRLVVSGEAVDDMYEDGLDYMYMGEIVDYWLDTSGSFADENCKVEITPKYLVDGNPIDMYYGFVYNATAGLIHPVVKVGEDETEIIKYVSSPTDYERILREELLDPTHAVEEDFWQYRTQSSITLTSMARFFRDIRSEVNTDLESLAGRSGYRDSNADGVMDALQKSQARWRGQFNVQPDMMFVNPGMKVGYCSSCKDHHCSVTGKCSVCGTAMADVTVFDLRDYQAFLVYTEGHTDFLTKEGYLTVTFDVKVTDCDGNVIVSEDIPVYTDRGDLITLKYKIGTKAGDKWKVSY